MRIISGQLAGRIFESPKNSITHPMSEKMRGAIFNSLGNISGLICLDAFAGSGALGLEALSRNAKTAVFIENNRDAQQTISNNIRNLQLMAKSTLVRNSVSIWSQQYPNQMYDILFADPPYNNLKLNDINSLEKHIKIGGIYVLSWPANTEAPVLTTCELVKHKKYNTSQLIYYRKH